jgi:hypothetical protein
MAQPKSRAEHRGRTLSVERRQLRPVVCDENREQARRSTVLAFSLIKCSLSGGSKKLSPAL